MAILTLDSAVEYTENVSPICLVPKCFNGDKKTVTAMGWGHLQSDGENSHVLRHADMSVVNNNRCKEEVDDEDLPDSALCAYAEGQDTCQVSPLCRWVIFKCCYAAGYELIEISD